MSAETAVPKELYAALVDAQANVGAVAKDSTNEYHRYKYAAAEDVYIAAKVALAGAGLALFTVRWYVVSAGEVEADADGVIVNASSGHDRIFVVYRLVHRSGELLDFPSCSTPVIPEKGRPQDKAEATALTFNLSYFLRGLLLIPRADESAVRARGRDDVNQRDDSGYEPRARARQAARPAPAVTQRDVDRAVAELQALPARELDSAELAVCAQFEARLRSAATSVELRAVGPEIKQAAAKGQISPSNYDRLVEIYNDCAKAMKGPGPGIAAASPSLEAKNGISPPANDQTGQVAS